MPTDGLSSAPLGIAERAADGYVSVDTGAGTTGAVITQIALAN